MREQINLHSTLGEPKKVENIPSNSQWLAGEGAGSWFSIEITVPYYKITRYSPEGKIECSGIFSVSNQVEFNINLPYQVTHLSHCQFVTILQDKREIKLNRIK